MPNFAIRDTISEQKTHFSEVPTGDFFLLLNQLYQKVGMDCAYCINRVRSYDFVPLQEVILLKCVNISIER